MHREISMSVIKVQSQRSIMSFVTTTHAKTHTHPAVLVGDVDGDGS